MTIRAIVIRGPLTDSDFAEIVALIRTIDDRHPTDHFEVAAVDPQATAMEMAQRVQDALPARLNRETTITVMEAPKRRH